MKRSVPVREAVGMVLGHDVTRIVPGKFKGRAFKRGHIIREEDIPQLLDIGKEHIYVLDLDDGFVHEDEAANRIARAAVGSGLKLTDVSEGKVNIVAAHAGLLKVDAEALTRVNALGEVVFATLHSNQPVKMDQAVAGTRIIPLVIEKERIEAAEALFRAASPVVEVKPLASRNVGLITTGSEVYHGRIKDKFGPVVIGKFEDLGSRVLRQIFVPDDVDMTVGAIHTLLDEGAEMIVMTGGMSVDPDDLTPASIRAAGARVVGYGAPVFPGAMFMLAHIDDVPIIGLPGCVMYHKATIFELVVPRILAGETIAYEEITSLGYGGFCAGCKECRYPLCGFGKG